MTTNLFDAIRETAGAQAPALLKHLRAAGIADWGDLTKSKLYEFRDTLAASVCASSAKTYLAVFKGILARYEDEADICKDFRDILKIRGEKPQKTYLTDKELERLAAVPTKSDEERTVLCQFLIGAYTGMRISDIRRVGRENIADGYLDYVSQKTGVRATVPCGEKVLHCIHYVQDSGLELSTAGYNKALRRLCKRAGIRDRVKVHKAGHDLTGEKWQFVSSHTARISFCTNLAKRHAPILDISRLAGHTSTGMTERYIVRTDIDLPKSAMDYFK